MMIGGFNLVLNPIQVMLIISPIVTVVSLDKCGLLMHVLELRECSRSLSTLLVKWWMKITPVLITAITFPMAITSAQRVSTMTALVVIP
jgi:hypothetical protein